MKLHTFTITKAKVGSNNTGLAVITIHSVNKRDENYYPQVF